MGALGVSSNVALLSLPEPRVEVSEPISYPPSTRVKFLVNTTDENDFIFSYDGGDRSQGGWSREGHRVERWLYRFVASNLEK